MRPTRTMYTVTWLQLAGAKPESSKVGGGGLDLTPPAWEAQTPPPPPLSTPHEMTLCTGVYGEPPFSPAQHFEMSSYTSAN